jgi:hypothetical protein
MRKISLLAGAVAVAAGMATLSTGGAAFAACLNPDAGVIDLTHNAMKDGAGWGYDKSAVDQELAKGNNCAVNATQQSLPLPGDQQLNHGNPQGSNGQNSETND